MRNKIWALLLLFSISIPTFAGDSTKTIRPQFIAANFSGGMVLPSRYISPGGSYDTPSYSSMAVKYGASAKADRWEDYVFGMPYKGVAVYLPHFSNRKYLGDPFSVFLFQGATLRQLSSSVSLNYELNLGASFNWNHYDVDARPWLIAVGASSNIHVGGSLYFKWRLSPKVDLHTGASITHFSNGALRTPNNGINGLSAFVEMAYHLQRTEEKKKLCEGIYMPPLFKKNRAHDLTLMFTTRTIKLDTIGTNLRTKYPKHRFKVMGASYSYMWHNSRRFMWGPSLQAVYDESVNANPVGELNMLNGQRSEYMQMGKVSDRFSAGVSLRGEYVMPGYSIFSNVGYDVRHKSKRDQSFYQIYGLKVYLLNDLFATFGVRSTNFTRSQYLYLNIGYTFKHYLKSYI